MALLVSDVFAGPQRWINDVSGARWDPVADLIPHLNRGMLEIVQRRPDAYIQRAALQLTPNRTYQKLLPPEIVTLLDVVMNLGRDGQTPGRQITRIASIDEMSKTDRMWQTRANDAAEVVNWIPAGADTQAFYVYPRAPLGVPLYVEALYSLVPPAVTAVTDTVPILPKYRYQMELFVVGNALMQDKPQGNQPRGKAYLDLFYDSLKAA